MAAYYFLLSSLPTVSLRDPGAPAPLDAEEFLAACRAHAVEELCLDLELLLQGRAEAAFHPAIRALADLDAQLRNAVARRRARFWEELGQPLPEGLAGTPLPHAGWSVAAEMAADQAFALEDPLEREMALDRARERWLDDMSAINPFGEEALVAYAGRLRLALRWASWRRDVGLARLEEAMHAPALA